MNARLGRAKVVWSLRLALVLSLTAPLSGSRTHSVSIQLDRHYVQWGKKLNVTCIVDRLPDNRFLDIGIETDDTPPFVLQHSTVELEGVNSPRIFVTSFEPDCEAKQAFCIVSDRLYPLDRAVAKFEVQGCSQ